MNESESLLRLGKTVQSIRSDREISQEKLADLSSLDRTYISSVERGKRNLSVLNVIKIANALQVTPGRLLKGLGAIHE
ncbi:Uncharacterised protein [Halioglobus japonicus]|nr:Uncharacterised protein [Halioglobus japonicus]